MDIRNTFLIFKDNNQSEKLVSLYEIVYEGVPTNKDGSEMILISEGLYDKHGYPISP